MAGFIYDVRNAAQALWQKQHGNCGHQDMHAVVLLQIIDWFMYMCSCWLNNAYAIGSEFT